MSALKGRTRRVTPAFGVAVAALVIACTGTAVAAGPLITGADIKNESVTGKDIKNGSLSVKELNKAGTPLWAMVDADGTLLRGKGVVSVERFSAGQYFVTFTRPVLNSATSVSLMNEGAGNGQVNWRPCSNIPGGGTCGVPFNDSQVFVNTEDSTGVNADRRFSVVILPGGADFIPTKHAPHAKAGVEGTR